MSSDPNRIARMDGRQLIVDKEYSSEVHSLLGFSGITGQKITAWLIPENVDLDMLADQLCKAGFIVNRE